MPTSQALQQAAVRRRIARIRRRLEGRLRAARNPLGELGFSKSQLAWLAGEAAAMGLAWGFAKRRPRQAATWIQHLIHWLWPAAATKGPPTSAEGPPTDVR